MMEYESYLSQPDREELKQVIREFLSHYKYLFEYRIQKLVFFGEMYCIENYGYRLTDAEFMPYDYGMFSTSIKNALNDLSVSTTTARRHGERQTKYLGYWISSGDVSMNKRKIIDRIHSQTRKIESKQLALKSKENWVFENETHSEVVDFDRYVEEIFRKFDSNDNWVLGSHDPNDWHESAGNVTDIELDFYDTNAPQLEWSEPVENGADCTVPQFQCAVLD